MSSNRKAEANRENAQHSTGPTSAEGKAKSSQNARRHGLSSSTIFIPPARAEEFNAMFAAYFHELKPIGEIQSSYFEQLTHAAWNLDIARQLLVVALTEMDDKKISNANRYIAQYERSFARAHQALKAEQTDMALRAVPENEPIANIPFACCVKTVAAEATRVAAQHPERTQRPARRLAILTAVGAAFQPSPLPSAAAPDENEPNAA